VRKPSIGAILLALTPFVAVCFSVSLWDRIYPMILGLPFNFFWLISWLVVAGELLRESRFYRCCAWELPLAFGTHPVAVKRSDPRNAL
jgi:hypothetical protein